MVVGFRDGLRLDGPPERDSPTDATDAWCERGFSDTWDGIVKEFGDEATAYAWAAFEAYESGFYGENDDDGAVRNYREII